MKHFLAFCAIAVLLLPLAATAQEDEIPAGLTPGSAFYFLENWSETVQGWLIRDAEKKTTFNLERANERLAELQSLCTGDERATRCQKWTDKLTQRFEKYMQGAASQLERFATTQGVILQDTLSNAAEDAAQGNPRVETLVEKLSAQALRHQETLQRVYAQVPEQAGQRILEVMSASADHAEQMIERVRNTAKAEEFRTQLEERADTAGEDVRATIRQKLRERTLLNRAKELQEQAKDRVQQQMDQLQNPTLP